MAQYCDGTEAEELPQSVEVVDLRFDGDGLGSHPRGRLAAPSLIVIDQAKCARQAIQVWQQIVVVEIWPAVDDDEGTSVADFSEGLIGDLVWFAVSRPPRQ